MKKVTRADWLVGQGEDPGTLADVLEGYTIGDKVECLHCGEVFAVGDEMVDPADGLLVCPTDGCDGSPLDWAAPGSWGPDSP